MVVSDNGTEFISNAILNWADEAKGDWYYIAPGKALSHSLDIGEVATEECRIAMVRVGGSIRPGVSGILCVGP